MSTLRAMVFLTAVVFPLLVDAQLPEHSQKLDREFANLYSISPDMRGVAIKGDGKRTSTIVGIVRKSDGSRGANADVWAYGIFGNYVPCREHTTADEKGHFRVCD